MNHSSAEIIATTKSWVEHFVIRHNLCPFAKGVFDAAKIRYRVHQTKDLEQWFLQIMEELSFLKNCRPSVIETSFLIHPYLLTQFEDYNEALFIIYDLLLKEKLDGIIQVASFHPHYQFADSKVNDPANRTNQSPYPMLHFLREASISRAIDSYGDTSVIPTRNISLLRKLYSST